MITFAKRARVRSTPAATLRRYRSDGGGYAVVRVDSLLGLPGRWLAIHVMHAGEYVISRHKTRQRAEAACQSHARKKVAR